MILEILPSATDDIDDAVAEIGRRYSLRTAASFLERVDDTIAFIRMYPEAAALLHPPIPEFPRLRARAVSKFQGRVIYWEIRGDTVRILRILQARRDRGRAFRRALM